MTQKYLVSLSAFKVRRIRYEYLSSSVDWWLELKRRSFSSGIKITYRAEVVDGVKRVYYAFVTYPHSSVEEYFLITSKKNASIIKALKCLK